MAWLSIVQIRLVREWHHRIALFLYDPNFFNKSKILCPILSNYQYLGRLASFTQTLIRSVNVGTKAGFVERSAVSDLSRSGRVMQRSDGFFHGIAEL
jgi:hypothetical protein